MTQQTILLEHAEPADALRIAQLSRDHIEVGLGWSWHPEKVARAIQKPGSRVLRASIRNQFAGFGIMSFGRHKANLNLLAVEPLFRRLGVGRKLLQALEREALERKIEDLYVQVRETNESAMHFYEKFGYEMIDRNKKYYKKSEAAIILYKYCPINNYGG